MTTTTSWATSLAAATGVLVNLPQISGAARRNPRRWPVAPADRSQAILDVRTLSEMRRGQQVWRADDAVQPTAAAGTTAASPGPFADGSHLPHPAPTSKDNYSDAPRGNTRRSTTRRCAISTRALTEGYVLGPALAIGAGFDQTISGVIPADATKSQDLRAVRSGGAIRRDRGGSGLGRDAAGHRATVADRRRSARRSMPKHLAWYTGSNIAPRCSKVGRRFGAAQRHAPITTF